MAGGYSATWVVVGGSFVERLVCHGQLPLIAGLDSVRPVVYVWEFGPGGLREYGVIDAGAAAYPAEAWKRHGLVPSLPTWTGRGDAAGNRGGWQDDPRVRRW